MSQQLQITGGAKVRALEGVITGTTGVLNSLPINGSLGIPQLDVNGKILVSQLPNSVMEYLGTWDASTNTPTLVNGTGNAGDVYLCNVAGTVNFGAGPISFVVSDQVIYSGSIWQKASGTSGTVTSVAASITGNSLGITGSPITTAGTLAFAFAGTNLQYVNGAGNLTTFPSLTGYVPYTGATGDVNLGLFDLKTAKLWLYDVPNAGYGSLELTDGVLHFEDADGHSMVTMEDGYLTIANASTIRALLNVSGLSANRDYAFPNASGTLALTSDIGITTLNTLTASTQTFATGTSGTDFNISSATATHTFNLPTASASNTGKLSSTDWSTFNGKIGGSGSSGQVAFFNGGSTTLGGSANFYWDNSTSRLGIGTNTPNASLGILNSSSTGIQVRTSDSANQYQANIYYDSSFGMVYGYNRLGSGTASNLSFYNSLGGFISVPESSNNNIGFNTLNPQGSSATTVYDFTSISTSVEIRLHNPTTGYTSTDGSYIKVTPTALVIANVETASQILINNGGSGVITIDGTNNVAIGNIGVIPMTQQLTVVGSIQAYGGSIYQTVTSSMLKANSSGQIIAAVGGTDYEYPLTFSSPLVRTTNTISIPAASTSVSGYLTSTDWNTFNNKGSGTVTSVTGTAPVVSSGGTTPAISMAAATTSVSGYLTSTDWNTFNGKFTLPSLTSGSILFSNGSTITQNNTRLYWDNTNMKLGIGTQAVAQYVTYIAANVGENANAWLGIENKNTTGSTAVRLLLNGSVTAGFQYVQSTNLTQIYANAGDILLSNGSSLGLTIANTTGAATLSSSLTTGGSINAVGTGNIAIAATSSNNFPLFQLGDNRVGGKTWNIENGRTSSGLLEFYSSTIGTVVTITQAGAGTFSSSLTATSFVKTGGTSSQFLKANGSVDSTTYFVLPTLTSGSVLFSDGTTIAQNNSKFYFDNTRFSLGVGKIPSTTYVLHAYAAYLGNAILAIENPNTTGNTSLRLVSNNSIGAVISGFAYNVSSNVAELYTDVGMKVTSGGGNGMSLAITTGAATFSSGISVSNANATTGGIQFPATQVAISDPNNLDDYEEGTWTAVVIGSTIAGTASYSSQNGLYVKIGRLVTFSTYCDWNSGTGTGTLQIGGLPFTADSTAVYPACSIGEVNNITLTSLNVMTARVQISSTKIFIQQYPIGGGAATSVSYDSSGYIVLSGSYYI